MDSTTLIFSAMLDFFWHRARNPDPSLRMMVECMGLARPVGVVGVESCGSDSLTSPRVEFNCVHKNVVKETIDIHLDKPELTDLK